MNAYELAEQLEKRHAPYEDDAATMLRQQADRIAELEETIGACYAVQKMQAEEVYKGNDRIAELEKLLEHSVGSDCREMRYIQEIENKDARIAELEKQNKPIGVYDGKRVYITTPQTKPLSDEEIWNWFKENTALTKESALRIARAIEERHGIK